MYVWYTRCRQRNETVQFFLCATLYNGHRTNTGRDNDREKTVFTETVYKYSSRQETLYNRHYLRTNWFQFTEVINRSQSQSFTVFLYNTHQYVFLLIWLLIIFYWLPPFMLSIHSLCLQQPMLTVWYHLFTDLLDKRIRGVSRNALYKCTILTYFSLTFQLFVKTRLYQQIYQHRCMTTSYST